MSNDVPSLSTLATSPLPYAYASDTVTSKPLLKGILRRNPEDFYVEEILGFEPEGEGEHVFLWIEKKGLNTQQVAGEIARLAKLPERQVSYSGMKDRRAVTRQWFSVHLPGKKNIDWTPLHNDHLKVLTQTRHLRKLRRGVHKANRFVIKLVDVQGSQSNLDQTLTVMAKHGVPNYFGEQRFGHNGMNVEKAQQLFTGFYKAKRHQRGIYLSAARSFLFNQILAKRVLDGSWNTVLSGELLMLAGSHSVFPQGDEGELDERLAVADIHLTGLMSGKASALSCTDRVQALEQEVEASYPELVSGLEQEGLKAERRALRVIPGDLRWRLNKENDGITIELDFSLPSGCFATAVIRELAEYEVYNDRDLK
jgi:tRNA pseudouridine13 synthase